MDHAYCPTLGTLGACAAGTCVIQAPVGAGASCWGSPGLWHEGQVAPWTEHVNASTQYLHSSNSVVVCPKMRLKRSISDASPVALARLSLSFTVRCPLASITLTTSDSALNPTSLVRFVPHPKLTRMRPAK